MAVSDDHDPHIIKTVFVNLAEIHFVILFFGVCFGMVTVLYE